MLKIINTIPISENSVRNLPHSYDCYWLSSNSEETVKCRNKISFIKFLAIKFSFSDQEFSVALELVSQV